MPQDVGEDAPSVEDREEVAGVSSNGLRVPPNTTSWLDVLACLVVAQLTVLALQFFSRPSMSTAETETVQRAAMHQAQRGVDAGYTTPAIWQDLNSLISCVLGALIACGVRRLCAGSNDAAGGLGPSSLKAKNIYSCLI